MRRALAWLVSWLSPEREESPAELALFAEAFVQAGGVLTLADSERLSPRQLAAFVTAADKVWARRAVALARAIRSPEAQAALLAPHDGGAALDRVRAEAVLDATPEAPHG